MTSTDTNNISDIDSNLKHLYDKDFYQWIKKTSQLMQEGKFQSIDWENVIDEIEGLAIEEKTNIRNNLRVLLTELLKYKYYQSDLSGIELSRIINYQRNIIAILEDSPSLIEYLEEKFDQYYQLAREFAEIETELPIDTFPTIPPFSVETILTENHDPNKILELEDLFFNDDKR